MDLIKFALQVLERQREAILNGTTYVGPTFYDASDPVWHELECFEDETRMRLNPGEPSHFDICEPCRVARAKAERERRMGR